MDIELDRVQTMFENDQDERATIMETLGAILYELEKHTKLLESRFPLKTPLAAFTSEKHQSTKDIFEKWFKDSGMGAKFYTAQEISAKRGCPVSRTTVIQTLRELHSDGTVELQYLKKNNQALEHFRYKVDIYA